MLPELPGILDAAGDTVKTNFPSDRIAEMIELAQKVDSDNGPPVRPRSVASTPIARPTARPAAIYKLRLKMDALAKLSIESSGERSRYASLPEDAPSQLTRGWSPRRRPEPTRPVAGSAALEHRRDGPEHDLEVEPDRPAVDVGEVEGDPPVEVVVAAARRPARGR